MNPYYSAGGNLNCVTPSDSPAFVGTAESQRRITPEWLVDRRELDKLGSALFRLSWMLSLPLICLALANLAWAAPDNAKTGRSDAKTTLKKGTDRPELLANVRAALVNKIRKELITLPQYDVFDNVNFLLDENEIVTLSGQVRLPSLKVSAERVVRQVEGVRGVFNQIEVLPTSTFDDDIRGVAFLQIYSHSQLSRYGLQAVPPIHIIVKNGKLTLEGIVATESDKTIAGIRANQVSNVFEVVNNLRIENP
jgi:hyperosmotically inducible periplasmic protein